MPGAPKNLGVNIFLFFPAHWMIWAAAWHSLGESATALGSSSFCFFILKNRSAHAYIHQSKPPRKRDWKIVLFVFEIPCLLTYSLFLHCKLRNSKSWPLSLCMSGRLNGIIPSLRLARPPSTWTKVQIVLRAMAANSLYSVLYCWFPLKMCAMFVLRLFPEKWEEVRFGHWFQQRFL